MSERKEMPDVRDYLKDEGLDCLSNGCWDEIEDHVKVHKYFLDRAQDKDAEWTDAIESWYDTVFLPLKKASDSEELHRAFPGKESGDLYIEVSHHWLFMKQYDPDATPQMAAHDYAIRYGEGLERWYKRLDESGMY